MNERLWPVEKAQRYRPSSTNNAKQNHIKLIALVPIAKTKVVYNYGGVDFPWRVSEEKQQCAQQLLPSLLTLKKAPSSTFSAETNTSLPVLTLQQLRTESNTMERPQKNAMKKKPNKNNQKAEIRIFFWRLMVQTTTARAVEMS